MQITKKNAKKMSDNQLNDIFTYVDEQMIKATKEKNHVEWHTLYNAYSILRTEIRFRASKKSISIVEIHC